MNLGNMTFDNGILHLANWLGNVIMPIAAVLALVGAILNFATKKPFLRLVAVSLALLTVSAIWKLLISMM